MKQELVKISGLVFDEKLYPRTKIAWMTAYTYAQAMRAGREFPPINVGNLKEKQYVVDGWHRVEARKMLKEDYVQANVKGYASRRDLFADSVRFNNAHGKPLNVQEKTRIVDLLKGMKFELKEISELTMIPLDKMTLFDNRVLTLPNGSKIYLKSMSARSVESPEEVNQSSFTVRNVEALLKQTIEVFGHMAIPLEDQKVKELAVHLYEVLGSVLQLV